MVVASHLYISWNSNEKVTRSIRVMGIRISIFFLSGKLVDDDDKKIFNVGKVQWLSGRG